MRKIIICTVLLAACVLSGCHKKEATGGTKPPSSAAMSTTDSSVTETPAPATPSDDGSSTPLPGDGVLNCKKSGDSVTVTVILPEDAGKEVSLLALSDKKYQFTWSEDPDARLSDIGQITLDSEGKGTIVLNLKDERTAVYIVLTAESGSYISEVR